MTPDVIMSADDEAVQPKVAQPQLSSLAVKLLPFWPADPQIWFAQVEAQFATRRITQQRTMFDYVVSNLSPEYATEIRDLILKPPVENPYDKVKEQLIKQTAASEQRRLQQLFSAEELGDRKPTQLLRRLQQLAGDTPGFTDGKFLRELFLQRLPSNVRMVLASTRDDTAIEDLAQLADKIVEVAILPSVCSVSTSPSELEQLRSQVAALTKTVNFLKRQRRNSFRRRSPSPARQSHQTPPNTDLCWYHYTYGDQACKCTPPCSKSGNDQASL